MSKGKVFIKDPEAALAIDQGLRAPYDGDTNVTVWAHMAALGVMHEMQRRSGLGDVLDELDDDLRKELVDKVKRIITQASSIASQAPGRPYED